MTAIGSIRTPSPSLRMDTSLPGKRSSFGRRTAWLRPLRKSVVVISRIYHFRFDCQVIEFPKFTRKDDMGPALASQQKLAEVEVDINQPNPHHPMSMKATKSGQEWIFDMSRPFDTTNAAQWRICPEFLSCGNSRASCKNSTILDHQRKTLCFLPAHRNINPSAIPASLSLKCLYYPGAISSAISPARREDFPKGLRQFPRKTPLENKT